MGARDAIELSRSEILKIIANVKGPEEAARQALEWAERDAANDVAIRNARTVIQAVPQFIRSAPIPPPPDVVVPFKGGNNCMYLQAPPKEMLEAIARAARTAASNPTVQRTAVGTGAGTGTTVAVATGFTGTVSAVFGAESLGAIGAMGGGAVAVASVAVLLAGGVGVGIGIGIDHLVGAARDDGRTLSDLLSGANAGVPVADPTGRGGGGWRFIADEK